MKNLLALNAYGYGNTTYTWRPNSNPYKKKKEERKSHSKTLISTTPKLKTTTTTPSLSSLRPSSSPLPRLHLPAEYDHSHAIPGRHTTHLVETFHQNQKLKLLIEKLDKKGSNPVQLLQDEGDLNKDHIWAVIRFLRNTSRSKEILQVFDVWKNLEMSRISEFNYRKIIGLLSEAGLMEEAVLAFQEMKSYGIRPSLEIYNSIIHGFARKSNINDALVFLNEMEEHDVYPDSETYDGLILAYGHCKMYDEIGKCVKKMEFDGCSPDHVTYNLLVREFSRGGLLGQMERIYRTLLSKRMQLQPSTLVAMLEAYANFRLLEKMEKFYGRVMSLKAPLDDDLVRKLACVYIDNHMFSRLDDLGLDLCSKTGMTDLVWCLRLLSHACLLSREGMDSILGRMEVAKVAWNTNVVNIILLAYIKMKDFKRLRNLLFELPIRHVKPDIITVGILFDAMRINFDGTGVLNTWRRMGFLARAVEMKTDPLVVTAFGKGQFLLCFEEGYSSLEPKARENKTWTYQSLIDLVFRIRHNGKEIQ